MTSIGQYASVFLSEEPPWTEKTGRPQSAPAARSRQLCPTLCDPVCGDAKSWTRLKLPCTCRCKIFFACGSSAPVRVEREGGIAAWLAGTLVIQSVQGHGLPPSQEL